MLWIRLSLQIVAVDPILLHKVVGPALLDIVSKWGFVTLLSVFRDCGDDSLSRFACMGLLCIRLSLHTAPVDPSLLQKVFGAGVLDFMSKWGVLTPLRVFRDSVDDF